MTQEKLWLSEQKKKAAESLKKHPIILALKNLNLTQKAFLQIFSNRLASADVAQKLEKILTLEGFECENSDLLVVVKENLDQEMGDRNPQKSHAFYREKIGRALGIWDQVLTQKKILGPPQIPSQDFWWLAGNIYYSEFITPLEFSFYLHYIQKKIPNIQSEDLFYLTDHIKHDTQGHEPKIRDILLSVSTKELEIKQKICLGFEYAHQEKVVFFNQFLDTSLFISIS